MLITVAAEFYITKGTAIKIIAFDGLESRLS